MAHEIKRSYPGKNAAEIYEKVHLVMNRMSEKLGMKYETDAAAKSGSVNKMGVKGAYAVKDGEVTVKLDFPMIFPMKKQVTQNIEEKLDGLFA
ncbi:MAG TPA: polyhydroxyalkanoic acid system family protein [Anaeromyxobacteraceae bacterium]|jgi:hypothetical protein|nr:polyhydroxyalkanoic acid system family protein [Anaeromyxobacteraceae bacterium]